MVTPAWGGGGFGSSPRLMRSMTWAARSRAWVAVSSPWLPRVTRLGAPWARLWTT